MLWLPGIGEKPISIAGDTGKEFFLTVCGVGKVSNEIQKLKDEHAEGLVQKVEDLKAGNMSKIPMYAAYFARLKKNWEFHEEEMERLERQRERILQELIEKRRNRNMYEKMREKDQIKWKKEQLKKEQKRLDEFGNRMKKTEELDNA